MNRTSLPIELGYEINGCRLGKYILLGHMHLGTLLHCLTSLAHSSCDILALQQHNKLPGNTSIRHRLGYKHVLLHISGAGQCGDGLLCAVLIRSFASAGDSSGGQITVSQLSSGRTYRHIPNRICHALNLPSHAWKIASADSSLSQLPKYLSGGRLRRWQRRISCRPVANFLGVGETSDRHNMRIRAYTMTAVK